MGLEILPMLISGPSGLRAVLLSMAVPDPNR